MTSEHPVTRRQAEDTSVYRHLGWYIDVSRPSTHASKDATDHLEELARVAVIVRQLDGWQAIAIHHAVLAGATIEQVARALGETAETVIERWHAWSVGQRAAWERHADTERRPSLSFNPADHERVAAMLGVRSRHVFRSVQDGEGAWYSLCGCGWRAGQTWPTQHAARTFVRHEHLDQVGERAR